MTIDATFWVAVSFIIFIGLLIYFKIPQKILGSLNESIQKIKDQLTDAEQLKEEAESMLNDQEKKISSAKNEIKDMIDKANEDSEKNILKTNKEFHLLMDNRKKNSEDKIRQMKEQAIKDIKNASIKIAIDSVEKLLKNSLDKSKLDNFYSSSIEETKLALKNKSS